MNVRKGRFIIWAEELCSRSESRLGPLALIRTREPYNRSLIPRLSLLPLPAPANAQSMPSILNLKFKVGLTYMRTLCAPCSHPCLSATGK